MADVMRPELPSLAICIPTFNRATILAASLARLTDMAARHDISIYISDNCSTDATQQIAEAAARDCSRIHYHRNAANIGMDGNFATALGLPQEPYVWLLGDDDLVSETALRDVLEIIAADTTDLILLNGGNEQCDRGRVRGEPSREFDDPEQFLRQLGWHATWISGLVIRRRLLDRMRVDAYAGSYFSHFIALFEALDQLSTPRVQWYAPSAFFPSPQASFSWEARVVEIFADRWSRAVSAIPGSYSDSAKQECIRAHGVRTGLLTAVGLLNVRAKGGLNASIARQYRSALDQCSPCPWWFIASISITPRFLLRAARSIVMSRRSG